MSEAETSHPNKRRIPHRIETARLVLRCYEPTDAAVLRTTITANLEHLGKFMSWVQFEPQSLDQKLELMLRFRSQYDADKNFVMGIFDKDSEELIGGTGLHPVLSEADPSGDDGSCPLEIGYWIARPFEGKGYITEAVQALALIAFAFRPLARLVIRMEPTNTRSEAIPKKLGFGWEGVMRKTIPYPMETAPDERRDAVCYSLVRSEFMAADWRAETEEAVLAFDALGRPIEIWGAYAGGAKAGFGAG